MRDAQKNSIRTSRTEQLKLSRRYWWLLTQGICALIFGILAVWVPQMTIFLFLRLFGLYALIDGLIPLTHVLLKRRRTREWTAGDWILLAEGIVGVASGLFFLVLPRVQTAVLVYTIAVWLLFKGFSFISQARRKGWLMGVSGVLAIVACVYLFINPHTGLTHVLRIVGIGAIIVGLLLLMRGLRARRSRALPEISEQI